MSKKDKGGAANAPKAVIKANQSAMKGFPKAKLKAAFVAMAGAKAAGDVADSDKASAGLDVLKLAAGFRTANKDRKLEVVVESWRDHFKVITLELAVDGNKFAELKAAEGDNAATARMTGYGNNVLSTAKGVLEFELPLIGENKEPLTYREVEKTVRARRHEARRDTNPDAAAMADARTATDDKWKELRKAVYGTGVIGDVNSLNAALTALLEGVQEQLIAQADLDEAANAAKPTDEQIALLEAETAGIAEAA